MVVAQLQEENTLSLNECYPVLWLGSSCAGNGGLSEGVIGSRGAGNLGLLSIHPWCLQ